MTTQIREIVLKELDTYQHNKLCIDFMCSHLGIECSFAQLKEQKTVKIVEALVALQTEPGSPTL